MVVGSCPLHESAGNGMSCIFCWWFSCSWQERKNETLEGIGSRLRNFIPCECLDMYWLFPFHLICTNSGLAPSLPQPRTSSQMFSVGLNNAVSLFFSLFLWGLVLVSKIVPGHHLASEFHPSPFTNSLNSGLLQFSHPIWNSSLLVQLPLKRIKPLGF